ncbi:fibronectin type III-like domain-contianing protein, partial [bacterium]|nr:fibronectin type III-like domain-contianing protein [bacterium]
KLTVTFPRSEDQLPPFDAHYETAGEGRGYRYYEKKDLQPLFPFGYGLSYTQYLYSNLEIEPRSIYKGEHVKVSVDVQNVGQRPGDEIVQFYVQDPVCTVDRPEKELKAFARVHLQPNEAKRITVDLGPRALAFYDVNTEGWVVEPGEFRVQVGASSQDIRAAGSFLVE